MPYTKEAAEEEVLKRLNHLREHGWCKGTLIDRGTGNVCLWGSLLGYAIDEPTQNIILLFGTQKDLIGVFCHVIVTHYPNRVEMPNGYPLLDTNCLAMFNDHDDTKYEDIEDVFDRVLDYIHDRW